MAIGLFGISEILFSLEDITEVTTIKPTLRSLVPEWQDMRDSAPAIGRGAIIGFLFGFVPGISHIVSTFVSYAVEKKLADRPEEFGTGRIEGVAGPETANNATTGSAMIPLLVLGIPAIPATAVLLSMLMIHGIQPGPQLVQNHPEVFWGLVASMYIGNLMLLVLNLPLVGLFINILRIPYAYLGPGILLMCVVGVYSVSGSTFDFWLMGLFGVVGYVLRKFGFDVASLLLAVVLGERMEMSLRLALSISNGDYWILVHSAFSKAFLGAVLLLAAAQALAWYFGFRGRAAKDAVT
jgi:putative tricarboxylic transport membrane protein